MKRELFHLYFHPGKSKCTTKVHLIDNKECSCKWYWFSEYEEALNIHEYEHDILACRSSGGKCSTDKDRTKYLLNRLSISPKESELQIAKDIADAVGILKKLGDFTLMTSNESADTHKEEFNNLELKGENV